MHNVEYAVTAGEGTLVAFGVWEGGADVGIDFDDLPPGYVLLIARCGDDCETGQ